MNCAVYFSAVVVGIATLIEVLVSSDVMTATNIGVATLSKVVTFKILFDTITTGVVTLLKSFIPGGGGPAAPGGGMDHTGSSTSLDKYPYDDKRDRK